MIEYLPNKQIKVREATKKGFIIVNPGECFDYTFPNSKTRRGRAMINKSNCMTASPFNYLQWTGERLRKLTPLECERLQTVPDNYTEGVPERQRLKMLGNGWTVNVIEFIFKNLIKDKMNINNVVSYFDGMSCGQIALEKIGITPENYYAFEIDKWAMAVTDKNYPLTIQCGSVVDAELKSLGNIDLLIGGSPCQGFSFAGKQLNFEDPRSKLFFEFAKALKELKPKYFLLENVRMKKESQDIISSYMGVEPVKINSSLFSAQNRVRLYWFGVRQADGTYKSVELPEIIDKGILLRDVLEDRKNYSTSSPLVARKTNPLGEKFESNWFYSFFDLKNGVDCEY